jgi:hypothetical protein
MPSRTARRQGRPCFCVADGAAVAACAQGARWEANAVGEREAGSETGAKKRMRRKGCDEEPAARLWGGEGCLQEEGQREEGQRREHADEADREVAADEEKARLPVSEPPRG